MLHKDLSLAHNHAITSIEFANSTEREGSIVNNLVSNIDTGKIAIQLDDRSLWILDRIPSVKPYVISYTPPALPSYLGGMQVTTMFYNTNADRDLALPTVAEVIAIVGPNYMGRLFALEQQTGIVWYISGMSSTNSSPPLWAIWAHPIALTSAQIALEALTPSDLNDTNNHLVWNTTDNVLQYATITPAPLGPLVWKSLSSGSGASEQAILYNNQAGSYQLQSSDASTSSATKYVTISTASANSLTVPSGLVGELFNIIQEGTGQTTIYPGVGVTLKGTPGLKLRAQYSAVTLVKQSTDVYYVIGDLSI